MAYLPKPPKSVLSPPGIPALRFRRMPQRKPLVEGQDYTLNERGQFVFTREFLARRGHCCETACTNCPYGNSPTDRQANAEDANARADGKSPPSDARVA